MKRACASPIRITACRSTISRATATRPPVRISRSIIIVFNHPSGFFARAEANWYHQDNDDLETGATLTDPAPGVSTTSFSTRDAGRPSEDFWQFNVFAGYRFLRNQCEIGCGVLNLTGQDYRLNPLNPYEELVRDRTFLLRCRLNF